MRYYHISAQGMKKGYYAEPLVDAIIARNSSKIKFLAGPFDLIDIEELRGKSKELGHSTLPIIDSL